MAQNYILGIGYKFNKADGAKMEKELNSRFARVAKKFGGAIRTIGSKLKGVLSGAMLAGAAAIVASPFERLNAAVDENLQKYKDLGDRAIALGTSKEKLVEIEALGRATGIQSEDMRAILQAFTVKMGEARSGQDPLLAQFTGEQDTVQAFYEVIKSLKGIEATERSNLLAKMVGEGDALKLAKMFNVNLPELRDRVFKDVSPQQVVQAMDKTSNVAQEKNVLTASQELKDLVAKSNVISNETVRVQHDITQKQLDIENKQLESFETFARLELETQKIGKEVADLQQELVPMLSKGVNLLTGLTNKVEEGIRYISKFSIFK